jgi:hypothetical protein
MAVTVARGIRSSAPFASESPFLKLIRLDSYSQPGLPEGDFYKLFTKCQQCRWVMTRAAFKHHNCPMAGPGDVQEVIDLTLDNEEDEL